MRTLDRNQPLFLQVEGKWERGRADWNQLGTYLGIQLDNGGFAVRTAHEIITQEDYDQIQRIVLSEVVEPLYPSNPEYEEIVARYNAYMEIVRDFVDVFGPAEYIEIPPPFDHDLIGFSGSEPTFRVGRAMYGAEISRQVVDTVFAFAGATVIAPVACLRCSHVAHRESMDKMPFDRAAALVQHYTSHPLGDPGKCVYCADVLFRGLFLCEACGA